MLITSNEWSPLQVSTLGAWFDPSGAVNAGAGQTFTLPNRVTANHATTSTDARKPTIATASNGVPILTCNGSNALTIPIHAGINAADAWGLGIWLRRTTTTGNPSPFSIRAVSGATGVASNKLDVQMLSSGADAFVVFNSQTLSRGAQPAVWTLNAWVFALYQFLGTGVAEDDRLKISRSGTALNPLSFQNYNGAPAALATSMQQPSGGTACILAQQPGGTNGWVGDFGGAYVFSGVEAGATAGILTAATQQRLLNFRPPA